MSFDKKENQIKKITPKKEFYEILTESEIFEILNDLESDQEIDNRFSYKGRGGEMWNNFYQNQYKNSVYEIPAINNELIEVILPCIKKTLKGKEVVNLIDTRTNNYISSSFLVGKILEDSSYDLKSYTTANISKEFSKSVLEKVKKANKKLIKNTILNYSYTDLEKISLKELVFNLKEDSRQEVNIFLNIGHGLVNSRKWCKILENYRSAMEVDDILILTASLSSENKKTDFGYMQTSDNTKKEYMLNLLGFDVKKLKPVYKYSSNNKNLSYILDSNYELSVKIGNRSKKIFLRDKTGIITWRHYLKSIEDIFDEIKKTGLITRFLIVDNTDSNVLCVCKKYPRQHD